MTNNTKRQLSTVLFADIVGYTALMAENEVKALEYLEIFRIELEHHVPIFNGVIKNFYGDGCLVAFQETDNAIACAKDLQESFQKKYNLPVRIGLDRGFIVFKDGNVFGDAVNLASRIEAISMAGGVLFSKSVEEDLVDKASFPSRSIGPYQFKSIKVAQEVFGLKLPEFPLPDRKDILQNSKVVVNNKKIEGWKSAGLIASIFAIVLLLFFVFKINKDNEILEGQEGGKKSIAVLPFKNLSDNEENRYFGDGMMDAILDHLARIKDLRVTSRTSVDKYRQTDLSLPEIGDELNVSYVLEGTVQQYGDQMRIIAQLIELPSDNHIWSKQYDESVTLENILNIQKEVSTSIAKELKVRLDPETLELIEATPTNDLDAYDAYLKGKERMAQYHHLKDIHQIDTAATYYQEAVQLDDKFAEAYLGLAVAYWMRNYNYNYFQRNFLDTALLYADKALAISPYLSDGYQLRGSYFFENSQFALAEQNYRRVLELDPNNSYTTSNLAFLTYFINGNYVEGVELFQRSLEIEGNDNSMDIHEKMGMLFLDVGAFEKAEEHFKIAMELNPRSAGLGWAYHAQGKYEDFKNFNQQYIDSFPEMSNTYHDLAVGYMNLGDGKKGDGTLDTLYRRP